MDQFLLIIIVICIITFFCAYIDVAFGMGYGTLMAPILLIMGFDLLVIVPILLISQMFIGFFASIFHQRFKNADFRIRQTDNKSAMIFIIAGMIAMLIAMLLVISVSSQILKVYIGITLIIIGIIIFLRKEYKFTTKKLILIGGIGAFNKAISGGGFGPIVTSGQIISGYEPKKAVAVTSFSETILSLFGFLLYVLIQGGIDIFLTLIIILSGMFAAPFGALHAKKLKNKGARLIIGILTVFLGILTIIKCFW